MKALLSFAAGLAIGITPDLHAQEQWVPDGPPPWIQMEFQTSGGITYFTHTSRVEYCHRVASGPVTRDGTNLTQFIYQEEWTGICIFCFACSYDDVHVSVLGALPPGEYVLNVRSYSPFLGEHQFRRLPFRVPETPPTLTSGVETNGPVFRLAVAGIPNVRYVVEVSPALSNWTAVATNDGGPFVWSEPILPQATNRFYRVLALGR